jgi:hypothetical protein
MCLEGSCACPSGRRMRPSASVCAPPTCICAPQPAVCAPATPTIQCGSDVTDTMDKVSPDLSCPRSTRRWRLSDEHEPYRTWRTDGWTRWTDKTRQMDTRTNETRWTDETDKMDGQDETDRRTRRTDETHRQPCAPSTLLSGNGCWEKVWSPTVVVDIIARFQSDNKLGLTLSALLSSAKRVFGLVIQGLIVFCYMDLERIKGRLMFIIL